jgi:hypothetical protein
MRFYTGQHRYYCGIDLHARTMYVCILDHESGKVVLHRNLRCQPELFLRTIEPYRDDPVVGVNASSVGTGSPISAPRRTFRSCSVTPCT